MNVYSLCSSAQYLRAYLTNHLGKNEKIWHLKHRFWLISFALFLFVPAKASATFFDASGTAGIRAGTHFNTNAGLYPSSGDYQATEKHFHLNVTIKGGDFLSIYTDIRFWPTMHSLGYMGDNYGDSNDYDLNYENHVTNPAEHVWYRPLSPTITQLYFEAATRYCLVSVGRRGRDLGMGIFLDSGQDPFESTQNVFDGISCQINTGEWRRLAVSLGVDKLREGSPLQGDDDAHQLFASISYDDRHIYDGLPIRKKISLYFAYLDSKSPYALGKAADRYFDIFAGLYWGYFSWESEGLIRMGEASGKSWEKLGGRRNKVSSLNSIALHSEITFTYPAIYPFGYSYNSGDDNEAEEVEMVEEEYLYTSSPLLAQATPNSTQTTEQTTETEESSESSSWQDQNTQNQNIKNSAQASQAEADLSEENATANSQLENPSASPSTSPSASQQEEVNTYKDSTVSEETTTTTGNSMDTATQNDETDKDTAAHESQASTMLASQYNTTTPSSTLTNHHRATLSYTFSPGDSQGYFKGDEEQLSQAYRSDKITALPLNKNFKPAIILFNMRNSALDIDGVYAGDQVVNAHVFTLGYSYFNSTYGNVHFKVIGATQDQKIPSQVESYFYHAKYDYLPQDYYQLSREQAFPVGYLGSYLGTELNLSYDFAFTDYLKWGIGAGYLFVGDALDVLVDSTKKENIIALESSLVMQF